MYSKDLVSRNSGLRSVSKHFAKCPIFRTVATHLQTVLILNATQALLERCLLGGCPLKEGLLQLIFCLLFIYHVSLLFINPLPGLLRRRRPCSSVSS